MNQKNQASTQKFTEIIDFIDNIVIMTGGSACTVIELTASNFALLSEPEQDLRIFSYASLLNSLSFPIQILIRNKSMDISSYIQELDHAANTKKSNQLTEYISNYKAFIQDTVTANAVLSKTFYVIIPFSILETGAAGVAQTNINNTTQMQSFIETAKKSLEIKTFSVLDQIQKFAISSRILEKEDLVNLFYDLYNPESKFEAEQIISGTNATIITGEKQL